MERKTLGDGIGSGKAVILVKEKGLGRREHPFWKWLQKEGFHMWSWHGHYGMDWVFINLNSMVYAPGMPGIKVVESIREHAITIEEFKTIWGIFAQYEGLSALDMTKKDAVIALEQDPDGKITEHEMTVDEAKLLLEKGKTPTVLEIARDRLVREWLENPHWREYFEKAPSEKCRDVILLEFLYSEEETEEVEEALCAAEKDLKLEDWQHLYRWCGNSPEKKRIHDRIVELGGE